ncbi:MAG: 16S rRNA (guanine(527)-N(7))-methyltransferase RsmG [Bacilli bacterium]|jgi:16S rRNA (guanine527-N7)-methyltransferase|nr:16S rRNA (guanine(527)-N(7))-methyltransferase RsmG [Bacilli bacterium]
MNLFDQYYEFLIAENEKYNLTSITNCEEVKIKHFEDSLAVQKAVDLSKVETLCDIGSGAGFPGIPLKIIHPDLKVTIIEPSKKRCTFLNNLVLLLKLKDVIIINDRAEDWIKKNKVSFDVVVARAVSQLCILSELCLPYVKVGGLFIAMKGDHYQEEVEEGQWAIKTLGGKLIDIILYDLSMDYGKRSLIVIRKDHHTDVKYPRPFHQIKNKPLLNGGKRWEK